MTEFSYPFASGAGAATTETDWSRMLRDYASQGVIGDPGGPAVQVYADSSGRQVFVRVGRANVRGHHYVNDATKTITIAANASGVTRTDLIVLRLDPTANTITAIALTGPASLTQDDTGLYDLPLASVSVANGAVTLAAGTVTDTRRFNGVDVIPCRTVADITGTVRFGQLAAESSTGKLRIWFGASWQDFITSPAPVASGSLAGFGGAWTAWTPTLTNLGQSSNDSRYTQIGKTVICQVSFVAASVTGTWIMTLPVAARTAPSDLQLGVITVLNAGDGFMYNVIVTRTSPTTVVFYLDRASGLNQVGVSNVAAGPNGSQMRGTFMYEAA